jgi:hypothetical protein
MSTKEAARMLKGDGKLLGWDLSLLAPGPVDADVRFRGRYWGQSGHALLHCICLLLTQSGHRETSRPQLATL